MQCVNISIENDNEDEQEQECFVFTITSMALEDVVLSTASATICIFDDDGRFKKTHQQHIWLKQFMITYYSLSQSHSGDSWIAGYII